MDIYFATGNNHKFYEVDEILSSYTKREEGNFDLKLKRFEFHHNEIRSDSIEEISREAVDCAYSILKKPVFVEDTGLFIDRLNGFPGTYSAWIQNKLGNKGILDLMKKFDGWERTARFRCSVAYKDLDKEIKVFFGEVKGNISFTEIGKDGFGYDSIFIPDGETETFAKSISLKKALSHRSKAITKLFSYVLRKYNKWD